ncbi:hypothetical protein JL924_19535, partial [Acinetobacter baumannii]|nr:hypothetical protein [Acinetobacter baumannii]
AKEIADLGEHFGHELYEAELRYLVEHEWVRRLDDAIWRRTKEGMWLNAEQLSRVALWLLQQAAKRALSLASLSKKTPGGATLTGPTLPPSRRPGKRSATRHKISRAELSDSV